MTETASAHGARSLSAVLAEIRGELKEFLNTRVQMAKSELHETLSAAKVAGPLFLAALGFISAGFLMLTLAVAAVIAYAFAGNPYEGFYGFLMVGILWCIAGAIAAFFVYNAFPRGRFPKRTVEVLKADRL